MRCDSRASLHAVAAAPLHDQSVRELFDSDADCLEAACDAGDAITLLDAQFGNAAHRGAPFCKSGEHCQDRILVNHRSGAFSGDIYSFQGRNPHHQIAAFLSAALATIGNLDCCAHLPERLEQTGTPWIE